MKALVRSSIDFWLTLGLNVLNLKTMAEYLGMKNSLCAIQEVLQIFWQFLHFAQTDRQSIKEGDEVITVAATFPTTLAPIIQNRLILFLLMLNLKTYNIDASKMKKQ